MHRALRCLASIRVLMPALLAIAGCTVGDPHPRDGAAHDDAAFIEPPLCDVNADADGDGIADWRDGTSDFDMDGTPNDHDLDSDGDTIPDMAEHGTRDHCAAADCDHDGAANFLDLDSDNDGIPDAQEVVNGTDPCNTDTDGDGFSDLAENAAGTNPLDPHSVIPATDFFVVLPYQGPHVLKTLNFDTTLRVADVYFLIDATGSMGVAIENVRDSLTTIASRLHTVIADVQMGVGYIEDFPFRAGGPFGPTFYGSPSDVAYHNQQDITPDLSLVHSALASLVASPGTAIGDGGDGPEAQVEGLYQTVTGEGGAWTFEATTPARTWTLDRRQCPAVPDERGRRFGYPCFRPGALPIVVMVTDIEWHDGNTDGLRWPYSRILPDPHHLPGAAAAFSAIGARFVGVPIAGSTGMSFPTDHDAMATMTGSVDGSGNPLVFPAPAGNVSDQVVMAIQTLAAHTPMDVTTENDDWQPNPDGVDATRFIKSVTAIDGQPGMSVGFDHHDLTTFYRVVPGTTLRFDVDFWNDFRMQGPTAQVFRAIIAVIGNRSARLDERRVYIIVPPSNYDILM